MRHEAIMNLYPDVISVDDGEGAKNALGETVVLDDVLVGEEVVRLLAVQTSLEYQQLRAMEYPPMEDYVDGVVKGDDAQVQTYIDACLAVKVKYPKPEVI